MSGNYLDCISPQELERLRAQHEAWSPETIAFLRDSGFADLQAIADVGCGPGLTAIDLATRVAPSSKITAIDVSDYYLNHIRQQQERIANVSVVLQDLTQPGVLAERFDGVFCRWFLAWVTKDLDTVLANVFRSLKPGGIFAAMEYLTLRSTVHAPPCGSALTHYLSAWEAFYAGTGGTTEVGAMLPERLIAAGFTIREMRCVGGLAPKGHRLFQWWKRLYEDFHVKFAEKGLLAEADVETLNRYWRSESAAEGAFIFTPVLLQIVAVK